MPPKNGNSVNDMQAEYDQDARDAIDSGNKDALSSLLEHRPDLLEARVQHDENGKADSLFNHAICNGSYAIVDMFIKKGANTNSTDPADIAPLMAAVNRGDFPIIELLIQNGADINAEDSNGSSVLSSMVSQRRGAIIEFLIEKGANINEKTLYAANHRIREEKFKAWLIPESKDNVQKAVDIFNFLQEEQSKQHKNKEQKKSKPQTQSFKLSQSHSLFGSISTTNKKRQHESKSINNSSKDNTEDKKTNSNKKLRHQ